jgi:VWFA-related protein
MFGQAWHSHSIAKILILQLCLFPAVAAAQHGGGGGSHGPVNKGSNSPNPTPEPSFLPGNGGTLHAEDESRVEFKSDVVLVQFSVMAVDKAGNHIPGLKKEDFQVLENGKEQKIATCEEVVANKSPITTKKSESEFRNLAAGPGEQPRSILIVALDLVNTPILDQTYGRKELLKFLGKNLDSSQIFGLVTITSKGVTVIHGLTGNSKELIEALNKVNSELPAMTGVSEDAQIASVSGDVPALDPLALVNGGGSTLGMLENFANAGDTPLATFKQEAAIETTMNAFLGIAWSLEGIPGKKSVIWATGGMPFYLDSPSTVPGGYLSALYERTMAVLNESNISVYPVDVRGLLNSSLEAEPSRRNMPTSGRARANDPMAQASNRSWLNTSTTDTLRDFAAMTGGRAFYNNNDIAGLFKRAVDDSSSYYLVSYYLDTKNTKPGWRQLKVKLVDKEKGKNSDIRARTGFLVTNATANPDIARKSDLDFALVSPFDSTGLPITVRWIGSSADGSKKKVQFGLELPINSITLGAQNLLNFDYIALAYGAKDRKEVDRISKTIRGNIPPDRLPMFQTKGVSFRNELELGPGEYTVRFVVRDDVTGRVGSVSAPLTVN